MKRLRRHVKKHLVAHKGNRYKPTLFTKQAVVAVMLTLALIEGAYLFQTKVVMKLDGFTAAVLPSALATLTNNDREAHALGTLRVDPLLTKAAQAKAEDMASKGYFAHVAPDGRTFRSHLSDVGYEYTYAGENLAVDFAESADVETAWMNSPTHRANILKSEYTHVGYGIAEGMYEGRRVTFVAQFLAAKSGGTATAPAAAPVATSVRVPAEETATIAAEEPEVRVLGSEAEEPVRRDSAAVLATSPSKVMWYMLGAFVALVAVLYLLALASHTRNKKFYMEVIVAGALILGVAGAILYNNGMLSRSVTIPGEAAAVVGEP